MVVITYPIQISMYYYQPQFWWIIAILLPLLALFIIVGLPFLLLIMFIKLIVKLITE